MMMFLIEFRIDLCSSRLQQSSESCISGLVYVQHHCPATKRTLKKELKNMMEINTI